jgi:4-hydroxy-4-methyl-2-oxoglutarate aldolase
LDTYTLFKTVDPTALADILTRDQIMHFRIRPLWTPIPLIAGPAYTVRCPAGDNLMLHAAIYRAPEGSVVVVEGGDSDYALAGGNVCAVAQARGIAGFVLDGVIRDLAEVRAMQFPVFALGVMPIPGRKDSLGALNSPIRCGGVKVDPNDVIVANEEGIAVVPASRTSEVLSAAHARARHDSQVSLGEWEAAHHARIEETLKRKGFNG